MYCDKKVVEAQDSEVTGIIKTIVANHEPNLVELGIGVIFRDEEKHRGGKIIAASVKKVSGLLKFFACRYYDLPIDVVVDIDHNIWIRLNTTQKTALVHHEFKHIKLAWDEEKKEFLKDKEGRPKFSLIAHDKEEFFKIEEIYGANWNDGIIKESDNAKGN